MRKMPKILGMKTTVGEKPKPLSISCLKVFNEIFGQLVNLKKAVEFRATYYAYEEKKGRSQEEGKLLEHGYFTVSRVVKWLAYLQLVEATKRKEDTEEGKKRTVWTVKATKFGRTVYKQGEIVTLDVSWTDGVQVGLGKPYGVSFETFWQILLARAEAGSVSKSRRESWYSEFRSFWMKNLLALRREEAEKTLYRWADKKIAGAPKMRVRRRPALKDPTVQRQFNHQLSEFCR